MADLRDEIAEAVRAEVEQLGTADASKAALYHRFQDRGASRATVYRAIDDGLRLVAERSAGRSAPAIEQIGSTAEPCTPPSAVNVTALASLKTAILEATQAIAGARRDPTMIPAAVMAIRSALAGIRASAGGPDQAQQLAAVVIDALRHGDATIGARVAAIFTQIEGQPT
jgi:hypothetical protein